MLSEPALVSVAGLNLEAVDKVDHIEEAVTGTRSDAASGDGEMGLAGARSADQHDVALLSDEAAATEIIDEGLIDCRRRSQATALRD